jgi:hypothetical protein
VRVPGRKPFIEIAVSKIRLPSIEIHRCIPLVRPTEREVKARAAAYRLWKPRASEHEAVAELRDHVLYVHYRGDRVVLVVELGGMVVDGPLQGLLPGVIRRDPERHCFTCFQNDRCLLPCIRCICDDPGI